MTRLLITTYLLSNLLAAVVHAQGPTERELTNDKNEIANVVVYGMEYRQQRHSTLTTIFK